MCRLLPRGRGFGPKPALKQPPVAPLWYPKTTVAFSDKVTDVKVDAFEQLDLVAIKAK